MCIGHSILYSTLQGRIFFYLGLQGILFFYPKFNALRGSGTLDEPASTVRTESGLIRSAVFGSWMAYLGDGQKASGDLELVSHVLTWVGVGVRASSSAQERYVSWSCENFCLSHGGVRLLAEAVEPQSHGRHEIGRSRHGDGRLISQETELEEQQ